MGVVTVRWHPPPSPPDPPVVVITERQADVLVGVVKGWTNARIGNALCLAEDSVKSIVGKLLDKCGADNRTHLAVIACTQVAIYVDENRGKAA